MGTVHLNLVARDRELGRLDAALDRVLGGDGAVCLVRGESGAGKTSLVTEFATRAGSRQDDLVVAVGRCDPQSGTGDAFLPFREVLQTLTGDSAGGVPQAGDQVEAAHAHPARSLSRDTVAALGPSLVGLFIPGGALLVVGTYRTSEVDLGEGDAQHPLEPVVHELARQFGDITVDLDAQEDGRAFIDSFLDQEPNRLDEEFRSTLHAHTGGHPLFTVELVHHLQDHGGIAWQDGRGWVASGDLDWDKLPARVEGVIGQRLARLPEDLHRSLTVAAVEGETFTAEVVARARPTDLRELISDLSQTLTRRHHLVKAVGVERVDGRRLSRYRFSHFTVQHYLLQHLDEVEAGFLHEDVGLAVEELYGPDNPATTDPLARHFDLAGVPDKAMQYAERAGDRAAAAFAHDDALRHYATALRWAEDDTDRIRLLQSRVAVTDLATDLAAAEQDIAALEDLVGTSQDTGAHASVLLLRARHADRTADYAQAVEHARAAATAYQQAGDTAGEGEARTTLGEALTGLADYPAGREELERGLALVREAGDSKLEAQALAGLGIVADLTGDRATGRRCFEESLAIQQRDNRTSRVVTGLIHLGVNSWRSNDLEDGTRRMQEALEVARRIGARRLAGRAQANLGLLLCTRLELEEGRHHLEEALALNREVGGPYAVSRTMGLLGQAYRSLADYPRAEALEQEALEIDRQVGDRQDEAFRLANLGELARATGRAEESQELFEQALALGEDIGDPDVKVLGLVGLACLRMDQQRPREALDFASRAHDLCTEIGDPRADAEALLQMGLASLALGDLTQATERLRAVLDLDSEIAHPAARVGLARVALQEGATDRARERIEEVVPRLLARDLRGVVNVPELYLRAAGVLDDLGDPRATVVSETGLDVLMEQAGRIADPERRRRFLEDLPPHRDLAHPGPRP